METMPYPPTAPRSLSASASTALPAAPRPRRRLARRPAGAARPGPHAARADGRRCAVAPGTADDRASDALHLAAAGQRRRLRALHRLDAPRTGGRPLCLLRGGARRRDHARWASSRCAGSRAGRRGRVGLRPRRGLLGHRVCSWPAPSASSTSPSRRWACSASRPAPRPPTAAATGRLPSSGRCREAVLRQSFERHGAWHDQTLWAILSDDWRAARCGPAGVLH